MSENNEYQEETPQSEDESITIKHTTIYLVLVPVMFTIGLLAGFFIWGRATAEPNAEIAELRDMIAQQSELLAEMNGSAGAANTAAAAATAAEAASAARVGASSTAATAIAITAKAGNTVK